MAKILAKIARRKNSNALPDRRELVEMDLFDTDRNPWPGALGGGGIWERYDYDVAVPFTPQKDADSSTSPISSGNLVVASASLLVMFIGGTFDVISGAAVDGRNVNLELDVGDGQFNLNTVQTFDTNRSGYHMLTDASAYQYSVVTPGTYPVKLWCWYTNPTSDPDPVIHFTDMAATVALLPT